MKILLVNKNLMLQKTLLLIIFCFATIVAWAGVDNLPEQPNPPRLVTDFTMTLSQSELAKLEQKLRAYEDSTSSQLAIVIVKDIGTYEMNQYATELALKWGIGTKDKDNGILLLWSTGNRKIYIATGYGMQEKVPDIIAKRIINNVIVPNFRSGYYYEGLDQATNEIMSRMSGQYTNPNQGLQQQEEDFPLGLMLMMLLMVLIILYIINKNKGNGPFNDRRRQRYGNGGGGFYPPWIITHSGGSSWGGGDSGNDWGGGGSDFGGFGGGDFGGGGAGGDY